MSDFSQRFGFTPPAADLHETEFPNSLRAGLWDYLQIGFLSDPTSRGSPYLGYSLQFRSFCNVVWHHFLFEPMDTIPESPYEAVREVRRFFFALEFNRAYAFLEFCGNLSRGCWIEFAPDYFRLQCNRILERERSAFRFLGSILVRITSDDELEEVSKSITQNQSSGVSSHILRATQLYSQLPNGDYRNSIKESISAVESAVSFVTGEKPSGISRPLKKIADDFGIHPAMRDGFEKLYAFTSDSDGIRHAILDQSTVGQAEARFMLISCSAFANFLLAKQSKAST